VPDDRDGAAHLGGGTWGQPDQDLDSLLTEWGSQSGPWRRSPTHTGGRHTTREPATARDEPAPPGL